MTSLEGVWHAGVRAAELETLMLPSSRDCPLFPVANGPLMARPTPSDPLLACRFPRFRPVRPGTLQPVSSYGHRRPTPHQKRSSDQHCTYVQCDLSAAFGEMTWTRRCSRHSAPT